MSSRQGVRARPRAAATLVAATVALVALVFASAANAAEQPAWRLLSISTPTNFWQPRDEVQEIDVTGTEGLLILSVEGVGVVGFVPHTATAAQVQAKLEDGYGAGNVEVTGEGAGGTAPFRVAWVGADAGEKVPALDALGSGVSLHLIQAGAPSGKLLVSATNVGGGEADGAVSPITISDVLPAGLRATAISGYDAYSYNSMATGKPVVQCASLPALSCTYAGGVDPGDTLVIEITVDLTEADPPASVTNVATVSGGGAQAGASASTPVTLSATPAPFGIAPGSAMAATSTTQAGAHPNLTTAFPLNTAEEEAPSGTAKDIRFDLPPGLVGSTVGIPRCTMSGVMSETCPADTMVGIATLNIAQPPTPEQGWYTWKDVVTPVYSIEPAPGEPAAFGFKVILVPVRLDTSVMSNGNYAVRVTAPDLSEADRDLNTWVTIWGVPAEHQAPGHNYEEAGQGTTGRNLPFGAPASSSTAVALLNNPSQCSSPLSATLESDSWEHPGVFSTQSIPMGSLTGCATLSMEPSISMLPDTLEAGEPAGYSLSLRIPQSREPDVLAPPDVKRVVTALPVGTVVSPSAAWGLRACTTAAEAGRPEGQFGLHSGLPAQCPREAQVGTVEIKTPALELPLQGQVYLGAPECDPCTPQDAEDGHMVRLLLQVIGEGESGIIVKLEGTGSINQQTGQITATFDNDPQLPFGELKLKLGGGSRAVVANPRVCGPATTNMDLTPWSTPFTGDALAAYTFEIDQGCFGPQFSPSFVAGMTSNQAGGYSPFTVSFGRSDQDEFLNGLQMQMPSGLLGRLSSVALCGEPQAAQGTCGEGSLIGHVQVLTGPGKTPFLVTGGKVFITEGYRGAPYGLSIVVPAVAGPYTLSGTTGTGTVVVRAAINVNPTTAALTVTSDPLPTSLDGIPLQLKVVNVTIDRPGFTLNPTNCNPQTIAGTLTSMEGASSTVAAPYQATNCGALSFTPSFTASTSGSTSRADGASLDVKLSYPESGALQANLAKVRVELPKQLPSRLTTLQKACTAATFEANPSACPAASIVGIVKATTPILPVALSGPVYFVSHGGEEFPSLIVVLQGDGVRVDLTGDTFISKTGITSSTFDTLPDVPVTSFELYLPEGPYSALAANGSLCKNAGALKMPTTMIAQNGAVIHQQTQIAVTGCTKSTATAKSGRKAKSGGGRKRKAKSARLRHARDARRDKRHTRHPARHAGHSAEGGHHGKRTNRRDK